MNHTNISNAEKDLTIGDVKRGFTITGHTAIGCEFNVTGGNPIVVKNNGTPAKVFTKKKADRIANELRRGGDSITVKSTHDDTANSDQ